MNETIIAADARVEGNLNGQLLRIYGQVAGAVEAEEVIVEQGGEIGGPVTAKGVRVLGRVDGPIQAERVVVDASGISLGGISAPSVSLAEGCTIQGRLDSNLPGPATAAMTNQPVPSAPTVTPYARETPASDLPATAVTAAPSVSTTTPPTPASEPSIATPHSAPKNAPTAFSLDGVRLSAKD